ncbi:MAG: FAD-dependent oxidoreductase [Azospirillaceae bacterium]
MRTYYDQSIVGAGIVGIAHALAAASLGLRVVVLDRDRRAVGASVRNFGLVTVTGQQRGLCHRRALRSRDIGDAVGPLADIPIVHRGLVLAAFRDESMDVIDAFVADAEMGAGCSDLTRQTALAAHPELNPERLLGALWSPHERRVDPRYAVARLARWLARSHDVDFLFGVAVHGAAAPRVETSIGPIRADRVVVCPGSDFTGLWSDRIAALGLTKCKLHMLRLAQPAPDWRLSAGIMNDTSVVRYLGYAELPPAETVRARPHSSWLPICTILATCSTPAPSRHASADGTSHMRTSVPTGWPCGSRMGLPIPWPNTSRPSATCAGWTQATARPFPVRPSAVCRSRADR